MKKMFLCLLCMVLALTGCQSGQSQDIADEGVYFSKIDEAEISAVYNPLASYVCALMHYDEKIYTSTTEYSVTEQSELPLDSVLGDELALVSGNHGLFWSTDSEELLEVTYEGTLYQVKGYDESFRVVVYYETAMPLADTYYHLIVFDHLNDISLNKGSELFDDLLHLSEAVCIEGSLPGDGSTCDLSESSAVEEFLAALYDGTVLDALEDAYPALDAEQAYTLSFYDSAGLVTELMLYEDGYVTLGNPCSEAVTVEVDGEKCKNIMEAIQ